MSERQLFRFSTNLERVRGLVSLHAELVGKRTGLQVALRESDVLRSAVVLLHACLEDLTRELMLEHLPSTSPDRLADIPIVDANGRPQKHLTLEGFAGLRGRPVDEIIRASVSAYLERSSYNHPGDMERWCERIGVPIRIPKPVRDDLAALMSRRHLIAHRLDRKPGERVARKLPLSISQATVERWIRVVEQLGRDLIAQAERSTSGGA